MTRSHAPAICPSVGLCNSYCPRDSPDADPDYNQTSVQAEANRGRWVGEGSVPSRWGGIMIPDTASDYRGDNSKQKLYSSGPQPFWHQGLVSWKTVFPQTWMGDDLGALWFKCIMFTVPFISIIVTSAPPQIIELDPGGWGSLLYGLNFSVDNAPSYCPSRLVHNQVLVDVFLCVCVWWFHHFVPLREKGMSSWLSSS